MNLGRKLKLGIRTVIYTYTCTHTDKQTYKYTYTYTYQLHTRCLLYKKVATTNSKLIGK